MVSLSHSDASENQVFVEISDGNSYICAQCSNWLPSVCFDALFCKLLAAVINRTDPFALILFGPALHLSSLRKKERKKESDIVLDFRSFQGIHEARVDLVLLKRREM